MITVLMSTYNGEKYLRQQLDSILSQKDVEFQLIVRDDGSTDTTKEILQEYSQNGKLKWYSGFNLGPANSFMKLLNDAPISDYYAFADQDDIWLDDKLCSALTHLQVTKEPAMYCGQTSLVDSTLKPLPTKQLSPLKTFGESLVYAYVTGCTMVINKHMRNILLSYKLPEHALHDHWCYLLAMALNAKVFFDTTPHILYRQHTSNVVGLGGTIIKQWNKRIQRVFFSKENIRSSNAKALIDCIGSSMPNKNRLLLVKFVVAKTSIFKRMSLLFDNRYRCGDLHTWSFFKLSVILNTY